MDAGPAGGSAAGLGRGDVGSPSPETATESPHDTGAARLDASAERLGDEAKEAATERRALETAEADDRPRVLETGDDGVAYAAHRSGDATVIGAYEDGEVTMARRVAKVELQSTDDRAESRGRVSVREGLQGEQAEGRLAALTEQSASKSGAERLRLEVVPSERASAEHAQARWRGRGYEVVPSEDGRSFEAARELPQKGPASTREGMGPGSREEDLAEDPIAPVEGGREGEAGALDSRVASVQQEIRSSPTEVLYAFGPSGETLVRQDGTASEVDLTPEQAGAMQACDIMLHNHPSGASFSGCDIATAIESDVGELRAVAPDGSAYVLRPPEGHTFRDTIEQNPGLGSEVRSARLSGDFSRARNVIEATWENQCAEVQQSVSQRVLDHLLPSEQAQVRMYDEAASRLADRWGLRYEKQKGS